MFVFNHPIYSSVLILHHLILHFFTNKSRPLEIFKIGFEYLVGFENKILFDTVTNEDGRINEEFILTSDDCLCNFEMIVKIGDYFSNYSEKNSNKIVSEIVIRINMKSNDKKYHIPLIISPNSYSTWWSK